MNKNISITSGTFNLTRVETVETWQIIDVGGQRYAAHQMTDGSWLVMRPGQDGESRNMMSDLIRPQELLGIVEKSWEDDHALHIEIAVFAGEYGQRN